MKMNREVMKERTRTSALDVIRLVDGLPRGQVASVLGRQLLRSGTAVGANYRAAQRARSGREFDAKLGIVEEECDETLYWMELFADVTLASADELGALTREANELLAIVVTARKNSRH